MGVNSCILGDDIAIGNNVKVGGGVILMKDVPDDSIIIGHKPIIKNAGNDSNLLIVLYVQIMPDDFVMQLHRF